jgi:glycylpeptide N-tetradecanoyltransferase
MPPGYHPEFHLGVISAKSKKLVAFISATPADIRVYSTTIPMAEINFLCIHKKLRSKRLAPVLIKEITRRVNHINVFQAVYTAGLVIPVPVSTCRYYHRTLEPKKLIEVGFSPMAPRMTMARTIVSFSCICVLFHLLLITLVATNSVCPVKITIPLFCLYR